MKLQAPFILSIAIALVCLTSCEKMQYEGIETWRIASTTSFDMTLYNDTGDSFTFHHSDDYLYKKQNEDGSEPEKWTILNKYKRSPRGGELMKKFNELYEEGYEYIIEVSIFQINAPIPTCAVFDRIVSKEKKESFVTPFNVELLTPGGFGE